MIDVGDIRRICPNDAGSVRGIPVARIGLLHFTIEADAAPMRFSTVNASVESSRNSKLTLSPDRRAAVMLL